MLSRRLGLSCHHQQTTTKQSITNSIDLSLPATLVLVLVAEMMMIEGVTSLIFEKSRV